MALRRESCCRDPLNLIFLWPDFWGFADEHAGLLLLAPGSDDRSAASPGGVVHAAAVGLDRSGGGAQAGPPCEAGQACDRPRSGGAFEGEFAGGVSPAGRPQLPIRRMVSLPYLKNSFNLSDEELLERWAGNVQWQAGLKRHARDRRYHRAIEGLHPTGGQPLAGDRPPQGGACGQTNQCGASVCLRDVLPHEAMLPVGSLWFRLLLCLFNDQRLWACGRRRRRWATQPCASRLSIQF